MEIDHGSILRVFEHMDVIVAAARHYSIAPSLLMAICYVESRGNPLAYNEGSMATGLFQVVPQEVGPNYSSRPPKEELFDSETNAEWGAIVLDWFRKVEGGSVKWGLFRYSGGIAWLKRADPDVQRRLSMYDDQRQHRATMLAFEQFEEHYWAKVQDARCAILKEMKERRG